MATEDSGLSTLFPQWILALTKVVRLCYRVKPYSLLQDPLLLQYLNSFHVVIRTMSVSVDLRAYQSS